MKERRWPRSTERIGELRLDIEYERAAGWRQGPATLSLDIVDYPGEWLLDLALIDTDYRDWSRRTIEASRTPARAALAAPWHESLAALDPAGSADEMVAERASEAFKTYLAALRAGPEAVATTPPGRFLMPGDLAGSPALTFAPLELSPDRPSAPNTLAALMERRFEAYKTHVVRPFFRDHFQRIDRQIVLVDVLAAVDAGPAALAELEEALDQVLLTFRTGRSSFFAHLFSPRADRVLFAATKADHVHHTSHDRLEALLRLLVARATRRTEAAGARVGTVALASVRATRETSVREGWDTLQAVAGTPEPGERVGGETLRRQGRGRGLPGRAAGAPGGGARRRRCAGLAAVPALPAAEARGRRAWAQRAPAAYPARSGARVPDRGLSLMTRQPRAFRLDDPDVVTVRADEPAPERRGAVVVTEEPMEAIEAADGALVPLAPRRGLSWGGVLMSALGGLVTLALGLGLERLIVDLFVASPVLGWVALGLAVVALVAFLAVVVREIAGMFRERRIEKLREAAIDAIAVKDHEAAKRVVRDLIALYGERTHTAAGRKRLTAWADEIIEADDRIALAERELVAPLDLAAKRAVAGAAKQVSVVTAISPRAIVDVAFVIFAAVRLLRRISMIYGGRPGLLGFLRLARAAFGHLAVTGGVAVGDSIVQQVLGLGLAARISAKLGEGVLNGLMTARFGLAAIAVCRPLPFLREEPPRLGDVAGELLGGAGDEAPGR